MYNVFGGHGRGRARSSFLDRVSDLYQVKLQKWTQILLISNEHHLSRLLVR